MTFGGPKITRRSFGLMAAGVAGFVALPRPLASQLTAGGAALQCNFAAGHLPLYISFSRPSDASVWTSKGVIQVIERDRPRFDHDPGTGEPRGLLLEPAAINALPDSRDMTGWLADGIVPSLDFRPAQQLSGTTIRAEQPRSTLLFRTDLRQEEYTFSSWIRRLEGYGRVSLTIDGGRSWTEISAFLLGRDWARVETSNRLARPGVGFHLEESGDAVAVDLCQLEYGSFATSEIITSGTSGFRRREKIMVHYNEGTSLEITWPASSSIREDRHLLALDIAPADRNTLEVALRTKARRYVLREDANDGVRESQHV